MAEKDKIVEELIALIRKGNAHVTFEEAVKGVPPKLRTKIPPGLPYSIWQLTEHVRIAQADIVNFCLSSDYVSPQWPEGFWPGTNEPLTDKEWRETLRQIKADRERFIKLLKDRERDIFEAIPWGEGQSLFREALLIADHNSYHTGEIVVIRRLLDNWD